MVKKSVEVSVFECDVCGKEYKTKRGYDKHLKTHLVTDEVSVEPSTSTSTSTSASASASGTTCATTYASTSASGTTCATTSASTSASGTACATNSASTCASATPCASTSSNTFEPTEWEEWSDEEAESFYVLRPWQELEDEEEEARRERLGSEDDVEVPKEPKSQALVTCHECKAIFRTLEGYVKHRVGHGLQAALLNMPNAGELMCASASLATDVLRDMSASQLNQGFGPQVAKLAEELLPLVGTEHMKNFLEEIVEGFCNFSSAKEQFLLPSALVAAFYKNSSLFLVNVDARESLLSTLSSMITCDEPASLWNMFLTNFMTKLSNKILGHILRVIGKGRDVEYVSLDKRYATTLQSTTSMDFHQNMHYIGGATVKKILRPALAYKHPSEECEKVINVIRNNFLISEVSTAPADVLMQWTLCRDRGKLTKISLRALQFFVQLGKEVKPLERADGSLLTEEVLDKISQSPSILCRWDNLKGGLSEHESFRLLHALVSKFCVTWRNGVIGRRHDEMAIQKNAPKHGTSGLAFRASVGLSK